ncbi:hypothetical protein BXY47_3128 [Dietzia kunjamensis]|uniref:hypothetical protein n=1 Tax=Dietzia kunjamensis TaxID=322509 RepID=UPI000E765872|nr:hypothetical protein [Dietzia kunjamensis]MBB1013025.1 hypothetical protein [Dietzia kunjamensis]RKE58384.1 hypothetical protein BXY47_3128 [Dietzia kunjamensis]
MTAKLDAFASPFVAIGRKLNSFVLAVLAAVLLVASMAVALWPVKTDILLDCGSFIAPNSSVLEEAGNAYLGFLDDIDVDYSRSSVAMGITRTLAQDQVDECSSARNRQGAIAGVLLVLGLGAGGVVGYRVYRSRVNVAPPAPGNPAR